MEKPADKPKPKLVVRQIAKDKPALTVKELTALEKMIRRREEERGLRDTYRKEEK